MIYIYIHISFNIQFEPCHGKDRNILLRQWTVSLNKNLWWSGLIGRIRYSFRNVCYHSMQLYAFPNEPRIWVLPDKWLSSVMSRKGNHWKKAQLRQKEYSNFQDSFWYRNIACCENIVLKVGLQICNPKSTPLKDHLSFSNSASFANWILTFG